MATIPHSQVGFLGSSSASDLFGSLSDGVSGISLKTLGRANFSQRKRDVVVAAKFKKWKRNHKYPWPRYPDPNVKGGVLFHLSSFKPSKEKPERVLLEFEKGLLDYENIMDQLQQTQKESGLDLSDKIVEMEHIYEEARKKIYSNLEPHQRLSLARHPHRPTFLDHVFSITDKFVELHGDRAGYDDPALVTGIGSIDGKSYMFMGHQKGRNTKEHIKRNFGMPTPHGYRKALRMMYYAERYELPIITFVDTPGAMADIKCEEIGQGEAIAKNLKTMFGLKVPILSIVIGEGGSGGALAICCPNVLLMLENAVFFVASPEACAAILFRSNKEAPKAAKLLKITAHELVKRGIADGIIREPMAGAHTDPEWTSKNIKYTINKVMKKLTTWDTDRLLDQRRRKFREMGPVTEVPLDPVLTRNMKKRDAPEPGPMTLVEEIVELRNQIAKAKESSILPPEGALGEMVKKLEKDIVLEYAKAARAVGVTPKFQSLRLFFAKVKQDRHLRDPAAMKMLEKLKNELNKGIKQAFNKRVLNYKIDALKEFSILKYELDKEAIVAELELKKKVKESLMEKIVDEQAVSKADINRFYQALKESEKGTANSNSEEVTEEDEESEEDVENLSKFSIKVKLNNLKQEMETIMIDAIKSKIAEKISKSPQALSSNESNKKQEHSKAAISEALKTRNFAMYLCFSR